MAIETRTETPKVSVGDYLRNNIREYGLLLALVVIMLLFQFLTNGVLFRPVNITNLVLQNSFIVIMALGMLLIIVAGHIDLSVGSIVAFIGGISAIMLVKWGWHFALVVPLFMMFKKMGLLDSYGGLIMVYTVFTIPIVVWLMLGYVETAPRELEEAAYVDGAGNWTAFVQIALPVLRPGISVAAVFTFIFIWNEYVLAYQLAGNKVATVTVYLPRLRTAIAELYGEIAAASLLSVLPAILFAGVMQRFLVRGLAFGGLK